MANSDKLNNRLRKAGDTRNLYSKGGNPDIPIFYTGSIFDVKLSTPETCKFAKATEDGDSTSEDLPLENYVTLNHAISIISRELGNEIAKPNDKAITYKATYKNADGKKVSEDMVNLKMYITKLRVHESLAGLDYKKSKASTTKGKKKDPESKKTIRIIKVPPGKNSREEPSIVVSFERVPFPTFDEHIFGALLNGRVDRKTGKVKKDSASTNAFMRVNLGWALGHSIDNDIPTAVSNNNKYEIEAHLKMIRNIKINGGTKTCSFEMVGIPKSTIKEKVVVSKGTKPLYRHDTLLIDAINNTLSGIMIDRNEIKDKAQEVSFTGNAIPESSFKGKPLIEMTLQDLFDYTPVVPKDGYTLADGEAKGKRLLQVTKKGIKAEDRYEEIEVEENETYDDETLTQFTAEELYPENIGSIKAESDVENKYKESFGRWLFEDEEYADGMWKVETRKVTKTIKVKKIVEAVHYKWTELLKKKATYETFLGAIAERLDSVLITRFGIPTILGPNHGEDPKSPDPKGNGEGIRYIKDLDYRGVFKIPGLIDTAKHVRTYSTHYTVEIHGEILARNDSSVRKIVDEYIEDHFKWVRLTDEQKSTIYKEITDLKDFDYKDIITESTTRTNKPQDGNTTTKQIVKTGQSGTINVVLTVPISQTDLSSEFKKDTNGKKIVDPNYWETKHFFKSNKTQTVGEKQYGQYRVANTSNSLVGGHYSGSKNYKTKNKMRFTKHLPVICAISPNNQNIWEIRTGFDTGDFEYGTSKGKSSIKASSGAVWYGSIDWDVDWTRYMEADITPILKKEDKKQITEHVDTLRKSLYCHLNDKQEWVAYVLKDRPPALERLISMPDEYARFREYVKKVYDLELMDTTTLNTPEEINLFFEQQNNSLPFAVDNNNNEAKKLSQKVGKGVFSDAKLITKFRERIGAHGKLSDKVKADEGSEEEKAKNRNDLNLVDKHLYDIFIDEWFARSYKGDLSAEVTESKRAKGVTIRKSWSSGFDVSPIRAYIKDVAGNGLLYSGGLIHIPDVGNLSGLYRIQTVDHVWSGNRWQSELAVLWDDSANKLLDRKETDADGKEEILQNDLASKGWRVRAKK